jgi:alpha-D-ribose 1-methylphosphonate 5-triphosphate synthase subunit PhnG
MVCSLIGQRYFLIRQVTYKGSDGEALNLNRLCVVRAEIELRHKLTACGTCCVYQIRKSLSDWFKIFAAHVNRQRTAQHSSVVAQIIESKGLDVA